MPWDKKDISKGNVFGKHYVNKDLESDNKITDIILQLSSEPAIIVQFKDDSQLSKLKANGLDEDTLEKKNISVLIPESGSKKKTVFFSFNRNNENPENPPYILESHKSKEQQLQSIDAEQKELKSFIITLNKVFNLNEIYFDMLDFFNIRLTHGMKAAGGLFGEKLGKGVSQNIGKHLEGKDARSVAFVNKETAKSTKDPLYVAPPKKK